MGAAKATPLYCTVLSFYNKVKPFAHHNQLQHIPERPMETSPTSANKHYLVSRRDQTSSFGYGLFRRTTMLLDSIDAHAFEPARQKLDVIDFGCADGTMLEAIAAHMPDRFGTGLGLDVFRSGVPQTNEELRIRFQAIDLFKRFPFPVADASRDVAIASAFLKHHPQPGRFLAEVARILRPGGIAQLLDPRPFVVQIGQRFGRFNPDYNPSLWGRATIESLLRTLPFESGLRIKSYKRYWVAPNYGLYHMGLERILPESLKNFLSLHQCLVLVK